MKLGMLKLGPNAPKNIEKSSNSDEKQKSGSQIINDKNKNKKFKKMNPVS